LDTQKLIDEATKNGLGKAKTQMGERKNSLIDLRQVPLPDFSSDSAALSGKPMMTVKRYCMDLQRR